MLHNAGRSQRARWEHTDIQVDLDLFNLNVFSIVHLSRCIMPHFLERNSGTFALMSSTAGKAGVPFSGSYTGSKHALHVGLFSDPIWSSPSFSFTFCCTQRLFSIFRKCKNECSMHTTFICHKNKAKTSWAITDWMTLMHCIFQGYFESLRTEKMATGISVTMLCPGPTFSNLLAVAATENQGEV